MTKEEYNQAKAEIIAVLGKPDGNAYEGWNESGKQCNALRMQYVHSCRAEKKKQAKELGQDQAPDTLKDIALSLNKEKIKEYNSRPMPEMFLSDADLKPFDDEETRILKSKFNNLLAKDSLIAQRSGVSTSRVTAFLKSAQYKILEAKLFDQILDTELYAALLQGVREGDTKLITELARKKKILQPEKLELDLNKPIEDPKAIQMLKELGDKLVNEEKKENG